MTPKQQELIDDHFLEWKTIDGEIQAVSLAFQNKEEMYDFLDQFK